MTPGELQWLSSHMGHDVSTHTKSYRLHDSHIEIAKVGRILSAVDKSLLPGGKNSLKMFVYNCSISSYSAIASLLQCCFLTLNLVFVLFPQYMTETDFCGGFLSFMPSCCVLFYIQMYAWLNVIPRLWF